MKKPKTDRARSESISDNPEPNSATRRTLEASDAGRDLIFCKDVEDMFKRLGIHDDTANQS